MEEPITSPRDGALVGVIMGSRTLCIPGSCMGDMAVSETCAHCNHVFSLFPLSPTVTLFPAMLTLPAGSSATFFCNISMENNSGSEYSLNWYKETNHSQAQKIAEISRNSPPTMTEKYLTTNHTPAFKMEILNLHQNDSGSYYCGLIAFFEPNKVMESNRSHLVVTGQPGACPDGDRLLVLSCGAVAPPGTLQPQGTRQVVPRWVRCWCGSGEHSPALSPFFCMPS